MGWVIECCKCNKKTGAANIDDLIKNHRDKDGWFLCSHCRGEGYIARSYRLQERNEEGEQEVWAPYLKGIIPLGEEGDTYQPFVYLVSYKPCEDKPCDVWFAYYKDTRRSKGGKLKMGYGPGGPPVLAINGGGISLVKKMIDLRVFKKAQLNQLKNAIDEASGDD